MKQPADREIGPYTMCGTKFDVKINSATGDASFEWPVAACSPLNRPVLKIGIRDNTWAQIVSNVLHELMEASTLWYRCLYERSSFLFDASGGRHIIHMDHAQFTEICLEVGDVLTYLIPDLIDVMNSKRKKGGKK